LTDHGPESGLRSALHQVADVEGWLSDAQARRLWEAAARLPAGGRVVEIGSFRGRSAIVLARAAVDSVEVVAIDPHGGGDRGPQEIVADATRGQEDFDAFHANLRRAGVAERVRHIRLPSIEALGEVTGELDLLYVDGAHRYTPARADIELWGVRVSPAGTMLIHDAFNAIGVTLAQLRLLVFSRSWRYVGRSGSLAEYRRERLAARATIGNILRQLGGFPYFARNMLVKIALTAHVPLLARLLGHRSGDWPY